MTSKSRHWVLRHFTSDQVHYFLQETLRTALAMGMDRAIHVVTDGKDTATLEPLAVAKIFAKIAEEEKPNIILLGKQVSSRTKCTV